MKSNNDVVLVIMGILLLCPTLSLFYSLWSSESVQRIVTWWFG